MKLMNIKLINIQLMNMQLMNMHNMLYATYECVIHVFAIWRQNKLSK